MPGIKSLRSKLILGNIGLVVISVLLVGGFSLTQFSSFLKDIIAETQDGIQREASKSVESGCNLDLMQVKSLIQTATDSAKRLASSSNMAAYLNVAHQSRQIAEREAMRVVEGLIESCRVQQNLLQTKVNESLLVAEYVMARYGELQFSRTTMVEWSVVNQFTREERNIKLPQLMLGDIPLRKQFTFEKNIPVVDDVHGMLNVTCTIFQKMNERGDFLRVATNVEKEDGTRAVGTFIPAVNPDGLPNPVVASVMKGETFHGRAFVVNAWYITAYKPIFDKSGQVIGILYVGAPQENETLKNAFSKTHIGESGYSFALDSSLNYLLHPQKERIGKNAVHDYGLTAFQDILDDKLNDQPRTMVLNLGGTNEIISYAYFKDWDCLICVSAHLNELAGKGIAHAKEVLMNEILATYQAATVIVDGHEQPLLNQIYYVDKSGQEIVRLSSGQFLSDLIIRKTDEWLQKGANLRKDFVQNCGVEKNPDTNKVEMRLVSPVMAADNVCEGFIVVDMDWDLVTIMLRRHIYSKTGYSFIVNDRGVLVSHPRFRFEDQVNISDPKYQRLPEIFNNYMAKGKSGSDRYTFEGVDKFVFFVPLEVGGKKYSLAATIPVDEVFHLATSIKESAQKMFRQSVQIVVLFIGICMALAIVIGFCISRSISRRIEKVGVMARRVSQGDFSETLSVEGKDEIGTLLAAINGMVLAVRGIVGQVRSSGIQVMSSATEISASARELEATAAQQASAIVEVGATSREISSGSKELAKTMGEVSAVAAETATLAAEGHEGLQGIESTMGHLMDATASIASKLELINEKTNNIGSIVTTITKVADQTNLLSLNASIEAEKAGEYGLGFAVVAREIRRLADQSAMATLDIEQMVKEMQSAVASGVMEVDKFVQQVRKGVENVVRIGGQLQTVIEKVGVLIPQFETVDYAMGAHNTAAEEISKAMMQLSEGAEQTRQLVSEFNRTAEHLTAAVQTLHKELTRFKMDASS